MLRSFKSCLSLYYSTCDWTGLGAREQGVTLQEGYSSIYCWTGLPSKNSPGITANSKHHLQVSVLSVYESITCYFNFADHSSIPLHTLCLAIRGQCHHTSLPCDSMHCMKLLQWNGLFSLLLPRSEGQSSAIPVASMEFAAICLRNALLLLPESPPQESKAENGSKNSSQSGSTESGSENSDACRSARCILCIH